MMHRRGWVRLASLAAVLALAAAPPVSASHARVTSESAAAPPPAPAPDLILQNLIVTPIALQQLYDVANKPAPAALALCLVGSATEQVVFLAIVAPPPCSSDQHVIGHASRAARYESIAAGTCDTNGQEEETLRGSAEDLHVWVCDHAFVVIARRNLPQLERGVRAVTT